MISFINIEMSIFNGNSTWIGSPLGSGNLWMCQQAIELAKHGEDDRKKIIAIWQEEEKEEQGEEQGGAGCLEEMEEEDIRFSIAIENGSSQLLSILNPSNDSLNCKMNRFNLDKLWSDHFFYDGASTWYSSH